MCLTRLQKSQWHFKSGPVLTAQHFVDKDRFLELLQNYAFQIPQNYQPWTSIMKIIKFYTLAYVSPAYGIQHEEKWNFIYLNMFGSIQYVACDMWHAAD